MCSFLMIGTTLFFIQPLFNLLACMLNFPFNRAELASGMLSLSCHSAITSPNCSTASLIPCLFFMLFCTLASILL